MEKIVNLFRSMHRKDNLIYITLISFFTFTTVFINPYCLNAHEKPFSFNVEQDLVSVVPVDDRIYELPPEAKKFIPSDYEIFVGATGDLNKDTMNDIAVVLSFKDEEENIDDIESIPSRKLMILFKTDDGYTLGILKDSVILCKFCGGAFGDPLWDIKINGEVLTISHYSGSAWRWGFDHKYKFIESEFYLIAETHIGYHNIAWCDSLDNYYNYSREEYDYLTGEYSIIEISDCQIVKDEKGIKKPEHLIKLEDFVFQLD